jgi:molecular chaperone GrpE
MTNQEQDDVAVDTDVEAGAQAPAPDQAAAERGAADDVADDVAPQPDAEPRSLEELAAALVEAERTRDEFLDHLRRERAEFENFRKRTTRERMDALDRGAEALCTNLLGVLDNFGFALGAAEKSEDDQLAKGVQMVHGQLVEVLGQAGLEEVPGVGQSFDPNLHDAMLQVDAAEALGEEVDEPVVVEVLRPGYRFKNRVLRPASVKVAR